MRPLLLLCFSLILLGCAQQHTTQVVVKPALPALDKNFAQNQTIPTTDDFYRLTPAQQQHFLAFFHHPRVSHLEANARIYQYLVDDLESFNYQGANTMAQQTLENLSGNCMSLAVMVTALAKLVDVEVSYRATYTDPVLEISAETMLSSSHVRSYLYNPIAEKDKQPLHLRSAIGIDYFRGSLDRIGQRMDNATFQAMVYNNLAVDALLAGDVAHSYWLSRAALKELPTYKESINLIAIIYRRQGNFTLAKQWFDLGLSYHPANTSLISNYLVLAEQLNDHQLQAKLQQQLQHSEDDNPYIWFSLAVKAEREEQYEDAIKFYRRLLKSAPYLHKANLALATLYLQQHDLAAARTALADALQYSYEPASQARYQAKLQMLEQLAKQPALPK